VNSASYSPPGSPGAGIAQGSMFTVFGEGLGPAALEKAPGFPLPLELAGSWIRIRSGDAERSAPIVYVSATQAAAILPSDIPLGRAVAVAVRDGEESQPFAFTVVRSAFGIYTLNSAGTGYGVITDSRYIPSTPGFAIPAGATAILWGTGLGPVPFSDSDRAEVRNLDGSIEVLVGNKPAVVHYQGRAPCCAGLDQIVFDLPPDVSGCGVSVAVRAGGVMSNFVHLPVAPPGERVCSDPSGFSSADVEVATFSGRVRTAMLTLQRTVQIVPSAGITIERFDDAGTGSFFWRPYSRFITQMAPGVSLGSCSVMIYRGTSPVDPAPAFGMDGGPDLQVRGPRGVRSMLQSRTNPAVYQGAFGGGIFGLPDPTGSQEQSLYLVPGDYVVNSEGGGSVGDFTARLTLPSPIRWTGQIEPAGPGRNQDLDFTWEGGNRADLVQPFGMSYSPETNLTGQFICSASADAGHFRVPSWVLSALPVTGSTGPPDFRPTGSVGLVHATALNSGRFSAAGIDHGFLTSVTYFVKWASFR
jgi:uncharacterized protein (TIGR03437 family)